MGRDRGRRDRGPWWYGWVKYTYTSYDGSECEGQRSTSYDFATAGQAQRAADALAGALSGPTPRYKGRWRYSRSKTDKSRQSRFTVVETGASRAE